MKKINIKNFLVIAMVFVVAIQTSFAQFSIPKKPKEQTSVYDYANLLSASQESLLKTKLIQYSDSTSTQIVIVTVETIKGEDIGILTPKWGHEWGVGQAKEDNGVFILLANKERKIWISPGYGVEHKLTAGITGTIVRNVILPEFRKGDFYGGFDKGVDVIFDVLKGEYKGESRKESNEGGFPFFTIILIIFILIIVFSKKNRGGGNNGGNRRNATGSILDAIILGSMGRSGFGDSGFGGSSGGGFGGGSFGGGFGGGGFSGGGAGGGW